jgi:predicted AAA+ superfamily ATPase
MGRLEMDASLAGAVLENVVLMELRKQSALSRAQPQFFYWRTAAGQDVDIVLEDSAGRLVGVEVKASSTLARGDVRGLQALANTTGKRWISRVVLYTGAEVIPFASSLHGVPLSLFWAAHG